MGSPAVLSGILGSPAVLSGILGSPAVLSGIFVLIIQGFRLEG